MPAAAPQDADLPAGAASADARGPGTQPPGARPPHLVLAVLADGTGPALVEYAHGLHRVLGGSWSVVALETLETEMRAAPLRASLLHCLDRAEALGARVSRISTGAHAPAAAVTALVHRVRAEGATVLLVGRSRLAGPYLGGEGQRLSHYADVLMQLLPEVTVHAVSTAAQAVALPAPAARARWPGLRRLAPGLGAALAVVLACTLLAAVLEPHFHPASLVMVFMVGVVYAAARHGRVAAVATVLASVLVYDWIHVPPRWSLKPADPQYWLAFAVMLVVGLLIAGLVARGREQAATAEARAQRSQALTELAAALARSRSPHEACAQLVAALQRVLHAPAVVLLGEDLQPCPPLQHAALAALDEALAREVCRSGREAGVDTARPGAGTLRYLPLMADGRALGVLVLAPDADAERSLEDQHLARALANQAALALERAHHEQRVAEVAIEAERERLRSTVLAGISHDFRTPLTGIVGNASLLIEQGERLAPPRRLAVLQGLLGEARRLQRLADNLLDLTRLEEGAVKPALEWCPVDDLVHEALAPLAERLAAHPLRLELPADEALWCDPRLIVQVLGNLLENALRHSPPGAALRIALRPQPDSWVLEVHDAGPGIPEGQERAIFAKFHQAPRDADAAGKGLGLAICAAVAQLHGGRIEARNDGGACFALTLPRPRGESAALPQAGAA